MDVIVVDKEFIRGGENIASLSRDIIELNDTFNSVMNDLAECGFADALISAELKEKINSLSVAVNGVAALTEDVQQIILNYIEEIDEKDAYLY